jgi:hypothetical protein
MGRLEIRPPTSTATRGMPAELGKCSVHLLRNIVLGCDSQVCEVRDKKRRVRLWASRLRFSTRHKSHGVPSSKPFEVGRPILYIVSDCISKPRSDTPSFAL